MKIQINIKKFYTIASILLLLFIVVFSGCANYRIYRISDQKFPKKPEEFDVELFLGQLKTPVIEIAVIDSFTAPEMTDLVKEKQMLHLRAIARDLGADAVHKVRIEEEGLKAFVKDEKVPFKAWKQGAYKVYFLRGTAVKYTTDINEKQ